MGRSLTAEDLAFLTTHPVLDSRRMRFDIGDLTGMVLEALSRRGMPAHVVAQSQWMWVKTAAGAPELVLILPGVQA